MNGRQLDLFAGSNVASSKAPQQAVALCKPPPSDLSDTALIAAIPEAGLADGSALATEAGRRRLAAAVPALEQLCRRFAEFGSEQVIPEQAAALEALAMIGGAEAAGAVARIICRRVVEGPAGRIALSAAARLGSELPRDVVLSLLRHADRFVRAGACRCVRFWPELAPVLVDLLDDLDGEVRTAAACAFGRLGRAEGKRMLVHLLPRRRRPRSSMPWRRWPMRIAWFCSRGSPGTNQIWRMPLGMHLSRWTIPSPRRSSRHSPDRTCANEHDAGQPIALGHEQTPQPCL